MAPEDIVPLIVDKFDASSKCLRVLDPVASPAVTRECFPSCSAHYRWWEVICVSVDEIDCINSCWYL